MLIQSLGAYEQVVGVTALFFWPAPLALKQGYLVVVGTVTAYVFTFVRVDHVGAAGGHGAVRPVGRALPGRPA